MTFKQSIKREKYIVIHGQSWRFRAVKYFILLLLGFLLYHGGGWRLVGIAFGMLASLAVIMHFIFRWKTKAWTISWGLYKKIEIPHDL